MATLQREEAGTVYTMQTFQNTALYSYYVGKLHYLCMVCATPSLSPRRSGSTAEQDVDVPLPVGSTLGRPLACCCHADQCTCAALRIYYVLKCNSSTLQIVPQSMIKSALVKELRSNAATAMATSRDEAREQHIDLD